MVEAAASKEDADSGDHNGHDSRAGRESSEPRGDSREEPRSDGEAAEPETSWGQRRPRTEHEVDPDDGGLSARSLRREGDRKSTRLNSSHVAISYAVFCLKKKTRRLASRTVTCRPTELAPPPAKVNGRPTEN